MLSYRCCPLRVDYSETVDIVRVHGYLQFGPEHECEMKDSSDD